MTSLIVSRFYVDDSDIILEVLICETKSNCENCGFTLEEQESDGRWKLKVSTCTEVMEKIKSDSRFTWIEDIL